MSNLNRWAFWAAAGALLAGCASHQPKSFYHAGEERPPEFLTGPISLLLTNVDGFSARVKVTQAHASGPARELTGDLLERDGRLLFQPDLGVEGKKGRTPSGMIFLWDTASRSGYLLSDPLQGYAPLANDFQATSITADTHAAMEEQVDGKPCRRVEMAVQSADGRTARFLVWEDEQARDLPLKIQTASTVQPTTLEFSDLRLELPPAQLFGPPDGYSKYPDAIALMNELIVRQTTIQARSETSEAPDTTSRVENWRTGSPQ